MNIQTAIVIAIIAAAFMFAAKTLMRKRKMFSAKQDCGDDCGCNGGSKKLTSVD